MGPPRPMCSASPVPREGGRAAHCLVACVLTALVAWTAAPFIQRVDTAG
jgi:hypothetical protein